VFSPTKMWLVFLLEGSEEKGTRQVISISGYSDEEQKLQAASLSLDARFIKSRLAPFNVKMSILKTAIISTFAIAEMLPFLATLPMMLTWVSSSSIRWDTMAGENFTRSLVTSSNGRCYAFTLDYRMIDYIGLSEITPHVDSKQKST
jgi:hypothetical protein